jgi:photosystem II stability/assembly factor-like uncharacterized protein
MLLCSKESPMKRFLMVAPVMLVVLAFCTCGTAQEPPVRKPTWETVKIVPPQSEEKYFRIAFVDRNIGYLASDKAIYKTEEGCLTWKTILEAKFLKKGAITFLHFQDKRSGWLGCDRTLYATEDGGESWAPVENVRAHVLAIGPDGFMLAGSGGKVFRKSGGESKWEELDFVAKTGIDVGGRGEDVILIAIADKQTAFVALHNNFNQGTIFKTTDRGKTWKEVFKKESGLTGLHFADAKRGWVVGGAKIWATEDGSENWKTQLNPEESDIRFLAFDPKGSSVGVGPLYSYGGDRTILYTTNGKVWRSVELDIKKAQFISASVVDDGCAYVLTNDGRFIRFLEPLKKEAVKKP